jgi:hypothetical protein
MSAGVRDAGNVQCLHLAERAALVEFLFAVAREIEPALRVKRWREPASARRKGTRSSPPSLALTGTALAELFAREVAA